MTNAARVMIIAGAGVLVWLALDLILLVVAAILLAIFLRTLAAWLSGRVPLSIGWSLAVVVLVLLGALVGAGVLYARPLAEQADQLTQTIPQAFSDITSWMQQYTWGRWLLDQVGGGQTSGEQVVSQAARVAGTLVHGLVGAAVILFGGLYLAADPAPYLRGVLRLVPPARRRRAAEVLFAIGYMLRWWLLGQALAMALVGLAMGTGLALIGVPLAFALGIFAGVLEFVPLLGPLLGVGPALLLAAAESTRHAAYVLLLYGVVQSAEGYLITPLVQRRVVHLPPVVTITAQVGLSWAAGAIGLLLAVPIAAAVLVAVQMLYVEDRLEGAMHLGAEDAARGELARATYLRDVVPPERARRG